MPCLPVDSAISCSAQSREPHDVRSVGDDAELVPQRLRPSDRGAEHEAGVGLVVDRQLEEIVSASSSSASMSTPASPEGTRPKAVSAE